MSTDKPAGLSFVIQKDMLERSGQPVDANTLALNKLREAVKDFCREEIRKQQKSRQRLKTFSKCALGALAVAGAVTAFELGYRCYTKGNAVEYDDVVKNRIGPRSPILAWLLVDVLFWRIFMRSQARKIPAAEWHYIKSKICGLLAGADPDLSQARKQGWQK